MYKLAPFPCLVTKPSVIIHSWSDGCGKVINFLVSRLAWAVWKCLRNVSVHVMRSPDCWIEIALSRGVMIWEHLGRTRPRTLYAPMNERRRRTVSGGGHEDKVAKRCGLADKLPCVYIQPSMVVDRGHITVFEGERCRLHFWRACRMRRQFSRRASGELAPQ